MPFCRKNYHYIFHHFINQTTNFSEQKSTSNTTVNGIAYRYTNVAWPTSNYHVLTINYFDNYDYPNAPSIPTNILGDPILNGQSGNTKTLATGTWVRVLQGQTQYHGNLTTTFYDTKGRAVATNTTNYLGGYTNTETKVDFTGQPQQNTTYHKRDANSSELTTTEQFTYTPQGRLLTHTHQVNNHPIEVLVHNTYDALGQLITKQEGGDETYVQNIGHLQTVDYQYNIRGWLKQINDVNDIQSTNDLFAFKINYDTPEVYGTTPLYNGNISETIWKTSSDNIHRGYGYLYDKLNRLTDAYFGTNHQINNHFNEHLSYDKNGNITTLQRTGNVDGFDQVIDDLSYTYIGNQLQKVSEAPIANAQFGFKDGTNTDNDYSYDVFGNMTKYQNKGITDIKYNHLNLPIKITFANGNFITYLYDAMGVKVNKYVQGTSGSTSTASSTDYLTGFQYNNQILQFFPHAEGYVHVLKGGSDISSFMFDYVYQYKDHLGNIRINYTFDTATSSLKVLEENHYYPFGLKHTESLTRKDILFEKEEQSVEWEKKVSSPPIFVQNETVPNSGYKYKFSGKEWQDELNLNLYDYGARNYDPALGRWMNVDPLAEKYPNMSPYIYCANNPVLYVDPDGREFVEGKEHVEKFRNDTNALIKSKSDEVLKLNNTGGSPKKIGKLNNEISELNNALTELKTLEDSDQKYSIFTNSKDIREGADGNVQYNLKSDVLNINIRGNDIGDLSHELKHAHQFEIGQISLKGNGSFGGSLYDQMDEKDAFTRCQAYGSTKSFSLSDYGHLKDKPNQINLSSENGRYRNQMGLINTNGATPQQFYRGYKRDMEIKSFQKWRREFDKYTPKL